MLKILSCLLVITSCISLHAQSTALIASSDNPLASHQMMPAHENPPSTQKPSEAPAQRPPVYLEEVRPIIELVLAQRREIENLKLEQQKLNSQLEALEFEREANEALMEHVEDLHWAN
ncbi:MAG: hypothetical protein AAGI38_13190 [Bacteroidota bacterium]